MGLDIAFNRAAALAAGIQTSVQRNGSDEQIARAVDEDWGDEHIEWLHKEVEVLHVPDTDLVVEVDGIEDFILRANKWGMVYAPLTRWLKSHGIDWSEF